MLTLSHKSKSIFIQLLRQFSLDISLTTPLGVLHGDLKSNRLKLNSFSFPSQPYLLPLVPVSLSGTIILPIVQVRHQRVILILSFAPISNELLSSTNFTSSISLESIHSSVLTNVILAEATNISYF